MRAEESMTAEAWHRMLQITGAVLGVPAAAAGTFAAYQSYFSTDVTCQKLRNDMIGIMERNVAPETKRSLLKKEVTEFDKLCGEADPEARAIFPAAVAERPAEAAHTPASAGASPQRAPWDALIVFGTAGAKEHYGWVAISRRHSGAWVPNFTGYAISDTSLPRHDLVREDDAAGVVRAAVSRLPSGACVRVLATRGGRGRLWAEVAPASCS